MSDDGSSESEAEVKQEDIEDQDGKPAASGVVPGPSSPVAIKKEAVDDGDDCMYIIAELT